MTDPRKEVPNRYRRGGIFPLLAVVLTLLTAVCFLVDLSPERTLVRALEKTLSVREDQEVFLSLLETALTKGEILLEGENTTLTYRADGKDRAELTVEGEREITLYGGEKLSLSVDGEGYTGERSAASAGILSASWEGVGEENRLLTFAFASLTDPGLEKEEGKALLHTLWKTAAPKLSREKTEYRSGAEVYSATKYEYVFSSDGLERAVDKIPELKEEERAYLAALVAPFVPQKDVLDDFLKGKGEGYDALSEALGKGELTVSFTVKSGYAVLCRLAFKTGDTSAEAVLDWGGTPDQIGGESLVITLREGEAEKEISLKQTVESDKTSYLRTLSVAVSDGEETQKMGLRFSLGKEKKDLGLRITLPQGELSVRGTLLEYRKGKTAVLEINRAEWRKERLFQEEFTLTLKAKGEPPGQEPSYDGALWWQE